MQYNEKEFMSAESAFMHSRVELILEEEEKTANKDDRKHTTGGIR